ncbi:MAG: ribosome silencing factor [Succinivibrio sp.]
MAENAAAPANDARMDDASSLAGACMNGLRDFKARDLVCIDVEGRSSVADRMLICSGTSSRHVEAIADHLAQRLSGLGVRGISVSGAQTGEWVIVDAGGVMVHIMCPEARERYRLEDLYRALGQGEAS